MGQRDGKKDYMGTFLGQLGQLSVNPNREDVKQRLIDAKLLVVEIEALIDLASSLYLIVLDFPTNTCSRM